MHARMNRGNTFIMILFPQENGVNQIILYLVIIDIADEKLCKGKMVGRVVGGGFCGVRFCKGGGSGGIVV